MRKKKQKDQISAVIYIIIIAVITFVIRSANNVTYPQSYIEEQRQAKASIENSDYCLELNKMIASNDIYDDCIMASVVR